MKVNKKIFFYFIVLVFLISAAIIISINILNVYEEREEYEVKNKDVVKQVKAYIDELNLNENVQKFDVKFEGYDVIGLLKIPAIDLEYPIISETTDATMKISISRFWGGDVNGYGNLSLAGHNNYNGTMFGKNNKLKLGDIVELTDLSGNLIKYEIKEIFKTDPNDTSVLKTENDSIREVTLITCSNGRKERLIIKALEINLEEK